MKEKAKEEKKKGKAKGKKKHIFLKVVLILLLIIIIAGVIFGVKLYKRYSEEGWTGVTKELLGHDDNTVNELDKMYCLLLGQSQTLTDTIMVASYDPKTQEAALLSIPRDTFIGAYESTATSYDKINAVYSTRGIDSLLEDVNDLTGLDIKYYLKVDTEALKVLVDKIGGVYFDVPIDMHYTDRKQGLYIDLKAGYQLLDGDKAEQVVRFRHNSDGSTYPYEYGGEDLGRMKTQRAFLTALLEQVIEKMDLSTVLSFIDIAEDYVETNLDFDSVKDYVPYILEFNIDDLKNATLPGIAKYANGVAIYSADEEETKEVVNELFYGITNNEQDENITEEATYDAAKVNVEVLNGSGNSDNLSEVVAKLKNEGFNVNKTGNTSATNYTTVIDRKEIDTEDSNKLKEILNVQNIVSGESSETTDVTVIIGKDY